MFNKKRMDKQILGSAYHKYYDFKCLQNLVNKREKIILVKEEYDLRCRYSVNISSINTRIDYFYNQKKVIWKSAREMEVNIQKKKKNRVNTFGKAFCRGKENESNSSSLAPNPQETNKNLTLNVGQKKDVSQDILDGNRVHLQWLGVGGAFL